MESAPFRFAVLNLALGGMCIAALLANLGVMCLYLLATVALAQRRNGRARAAAALVVAVACHGAFLLGWGAACAAAARRFAVEGVPVLSAAGTVAAMAWAAAPFLLLSAREKWMWRRAPQRLAIVTHLYRKAADTRHSPSDEAGGIDGGLSLTRLAWMAQAAIAAGSCALFLWLVRAGGMAPP
jgi:hypothetical protein